MIGYPTVVDLVLLRQSLSDSFTVFWWTRLFWRHVRSGRRVLAMCVEKRREACTLCATVITSGAV